MIPGMDQLVLVQPGLTVQERVTQGKPEYRKFFFMNYIIEWEQMHVKKDATCYSTMDDKEEIEHTY